jgi:hypothetical protein
MACDPVQKAAMVWSVLSVTAASSVGSFQGALGLRPHHAGDGVGVFTFVALDWDWRPRPGRNRPNSSVMAEGL